MWSRQLAASPESPGGTDLLELLDDLLILVQVWLVGGVHACGATHGGTDAELPLETLLLKMCCLLENTSWGGGLPGLESSVFRFFSFLTFICLAISPEKHRETSRLDTEENFRGWKQRRRCRKEPSAEKGLPGRTTFPWRHQRMGLNRPSRRFLL